MILYDEFYPLALEMLEEFGAPAQLVRITEAYDAITDRSISTETSTTVLAVVGPHTWEDDEGREVTRSTVTLLAKPATGDKLNQGDMAYTISRVTTIAPQGKAIVYLAEVS